jgi:hypothetical protein
MDELTTYQDEAACIQPSILHDLSQGMFHGCFCLLKNHRQFGFTTQSCDMNYSMLRYLSLHHLKEEMWLSFMLSLNA